jgi:hypothetical protein
VAIPQSAQDSLISKLSAHRRRRWPELEDIRVRFRANLAYVDGLLPDGEVQRLCRLRYGGSATYWGFAIYLASRDGYQDSVLPSGAFEGTPEEALDCASTLYIQPLNPTHQPGSRTSGQTH